MIFISEPQIYQCDAIKVMQHLHGQYKYFLNSEDLFDLDLPLLKSKAHGGTMAMWKASLDPFISVQQPPSSSFLPIVFSPPDSITSIHVSVYLPTHGQDARFVDDLAALMVCLDDLREVHREAPVFLRGDFNVNDRNLKRVNLLKTFCSDLNLTYVPINHNTYHHFTGNGSSDSNLDKLLFTNSDNINETIKTICCKLETPLVDSHHDLIVSTFKLQEIAQIEANAENIVAPRVQNLRMKVTWSDQGIEAYQAMITPELKRVANLWSSSCSSSTTSFSMLCDSTNKILSTCAEATNKTVKLSQKFSFKSKPIPLIVRQSRNSLLKLHKKMKHAVGNLLPDSQKLKHEYIDARTKHRKLVRENKAKDAIERDKKVSEILSKNPLSIFKQIRQAKRNQSATINKLHVGDKTYLDSSVPDGFFDSISRLKSRDPDSLSKSETFASFNEDYKNIIAISHHGEKISAISESDSLALLQKMKPDVNDYFSISPNHYLHAGPAGWKHFHLLLSLLIINVNTTNITEINSIYACILLKGHGKSKYSDRSYRTISTCPVVAKALDTHIMNLHIKSWNSSQSECQFQGEGSSHELAALLLTECIQHSLHHLRQPLFILYLDAKSAFDVVMKELLIKNLFFSGESLLYINSRLENRQTFLDWNGQIMGPIKDQQGLEQGGVSSSDFYKIFSREQLETAQKSSLGIPLGPLTVSGIGQADDTSLVSNNIHQLYFLLHLTKIFCDKYHVKLCSEKTKLQVYSTDKMKLLVDYAKAVNPITVNDNKIEFTETVEHVGMLRSSSGNLPTILARTAAHKKALGAVLHTGMARCHRGNPAASIRILKIYGNPVLMSGLGSLVLTNYELNIINQHHKIIISNLQRLLPLTPTPVVYFLAGTLPGAALLQLRQLSLFGMITRMSSSNIINKHAKNFFTFNTISSKSWFNQLRDVCVQYSLPHPAQLLADPPSKDVYKKLVRKKVIDYWEQKLRHEASHLKSLEFFKPEFMSLAKPHPIWSTTGPSPTKVVMASVQALLISGRYRTESLASHWTPNSNGICKLSNTCNVTEDVKHFLQFCSALDVTRDKLNVFTQSYCNSHPEVSLIVKKYCTPESHLFTQFLNDCSTIPEVIEAVQRNEQNFLTHIYNITRIWCYTLHRERLKILGQWRNFAKC